MREGEREGSRQAGREGGREGGSAFEQIICNLRNIS